MIRIEGKRMATLTRKQIMLSQENLSRLHEWTARYDLSEAELVRRAIQAYDPDEAVVASISQEQEREAAAMLEQIEAALKSAMAAVDDSNRQILQTLAGLVDSEQRSAITREVQQEVAENPGFLDEVADLMGGLNEDAA
jgi:UDP-glucose 6-dehydrogenase